MKSTTKKPATKQSATKKPTGKKPATKQSATKKSTGKKPATKKPATRKPREMQVKETTDASQKVVLNE